MYSPTYNEKNVLGEVCDIGLINFLRKTNILNKI